ncbi:MAG: glycerol-3-phosphate 1-O-acyltransferase PlsY [Planctomycetota bacterium]|jgi:glycerol-3-phosphate acyltransferase PlsY
MEILVWCAAIIGGYLLGAVPFGWMLAKLIRGVDIRTTGSRNIGATNAARTLGKKWFFVVLFLDAAKGAGPALIGRFALASFSPHLGIAAGAAALIGHMLPVYLKFKGGKGIATGLGVMLSLATYSTLIAFGVFVIMFALFRYISLASLAAAAALVPAHVLLCRDTFFSKELPVTVFIAVVVAAVFIKHVSNIMRLLAGTEPKVGGGKTFGKKEESESEPAAASAADGEK